ncbi:hypothetical protein ACQY0O_003434 [Thecaphora frezii]
MAVTPSSFPSITATTPGPHSDNPGLLQDITGHWSGFPHQAHPSDHYSLEHQLSHSQLQGLHHSAEHSNPSFGHKAGADGTLFSIPFAQNQYPTAQQPSPAQVSDFVAHLQAMLNYQYYHQGFLDHSSDDYYHHHHEGQHWQEQGGYSDSPSDVKLEPLREALGSPPRHLQVQPPYPFHNQHQQQAWLAQRDPSAAAGSYPPQANVEHPYPFNDQPHQYHDQPVYGTSAVLAPGQQSRIQPGPHSAHAGPGSFTYGQQGTGFDPHGISYANQPARWSHHVGDAAAASKNDMLSIGQWLKTKTEGHSFDVIPGNINERETVLKRVKEIVRKTPWRNDAVVQQVDDIRWRDDIEAKPLKEYQNAIRSMKKYMDDERPPTEDWAEIAFEYIRFDTENLIVRFKAFDQRVSPIPSTPGFGLYRIVAKRKEQDKKCLYVGDLLVPNDFNKEYWGQKKKPHSEAS